MRFITHSLVYIFLFSLQSLFAQNRVDVGAINVNSSFLQSKYVTKLAKDKAKLDGSPFLFKNEEQAYVVPKNNSKSELLTINYDLLNKVTMLYVNGESYTIDSQFLDSLYLYDSGRLFIYTKTEEDSGISILEILVDGTHPLLKKENALLLRPSYNAAYQAGSKNYLIMRNTQYYTMDDSGVLVVLPKKHKKIRNSEHIPQALKSKMNKLKPKMNNEESLKRCFTIINQ